MAVNNIYKKIGRTAPKNYSNVLSAVEKVRHEIDKHVKNVAAKEKILKADIDACIFNLLKAHLDRERTHTNLSFSGTPEYVIPNTHITDLFTGFIVNCETKNQIVFYRFRSADGAETFVKRFSELQLEQLRYILTLTVNYNHRIVQ